MKNEVNDIHKKIDNKYYNYYSFEELYGFKPKNRLNKSDFKNCDRLLNFEEIQSYKKNIETLSGPMDSAWSTKCHDNLNTGRSPSPTAYYPSVEKWRFKTDGYLDSSPVISEDGIIYFGDNDDYLHALYPNGTEKWKIDVDGWVWDGPTIDEDGTIYVGTMGARLYAINANGTKKWHCAAHGSVFTAPKIGDDGTIYFGNADNNMVAINPDGTLKWIYNTKAAIHSDPAIGDDGTIYNGCLNSYFYAFNPNGTLKWKYKTGDRIYGAPSIAEDGTIYIGSSWDSYLYALNPNGTLKWKYKKAGTPSNPSIASDGTIYSTYLHNLVALNPNGTLKWEFYVGEARYFGKSAPAISSDGIIYIGVNNVDVSGGWIYAINPDGNLSWRKKISHEWVDSSPCIDEDGTVYIGSSSNDAGDSYGYLYAFGNPDIKVGTNGPYYSLEYVLIHFFGFADYGNPPYEYHWDFGDSHTSSEQNPDHYYTEAGVYDVVLTVTDVDGNLSENTTFAWVQETNTPPTTPIIDGPANGKINTKYNYNFVSEEPDGTDMVWYFIEWDDNSNSGWLGPYKSGESITQSHKWKDDGTYIIRAKSKDVYDDESPWGEFEIKISNPRTRTYWLSFLDLFPLLQKILNNILTNTLI